MSSCCRRLLAQKRKQNRKDALRRQKLGQRRKAMHAERKAKIAVLQVRKLLSGQQRLCCCGWCYHNPELQVKSAVSRRRGHLL